MSSNPSVCSNSFSFLFFSSSLGIYSKGVLWGPLAFWSSNPASTARLDVPSYRALELVPGIEVLEEEGGQGREIEPSSGWRQDETWSTGWVVLVSNWDCGGCAAWVRGVMRWDKLVFGLTVVSNALRSSPSLAKELRTKDGPVSPSDKVCPRGEREIYSREFNLGCCCKAWDCGANRRHVRR